MEAANSLSSFPRVISEEDQAADKEDNVSSFSQFRIESPNLTMNFSEIKLKFFGFIFVGFILLLILLNEEDCLGEFKRLNCSLKINEKTQDCEFYRKCLVEGTSIIMKLVYIFLYAGGILWYSINTYKEKVL